MTNKEIVERFDKYLEARTYAENTRISYLRNVKEFLEIVGEPYDSLEFEHKIKYDKYLKSRDISLTTCNAKISSVITFFKFLHKSNIYKNDLYTMFELERNATANSNPHKVVNIEELMSIRDYVKGLKFSFMNQRKKIIMLLFIYTGIRRDEMTNLKWSNLDSEQLTIFIDKAKRNELRYVKINDLLVRELKWWKQLCEERELDSEYIIVNGKNKPIGNRELNDLVKRVMSHLNMDYTPHCLRKGSATMMFVSGHSLEEIQQMLGHSSRSVTELYVKPKYESNMAEDNILNK